MKVMRICGGIVLLVNGVFAQGTLSAIGGYGTVPIDGYAPFAVVYTSDTIGWSFTTSQNLEVTSLGSAPGADPMTSQIEVGLWGGDGSLLASASVNISADPSFSSINPVMLQAGNTYIIGAWAANGPVVFTIPLEPMTASQIEPVEVAFSPQNTFAFPTPSGTVFNGQETTLPLANFQFDAVPEPATVWLVGAGIFAFAVRRANRNQSS